MHIVEDIGKQQPSEQQHGSNLRPVLTVEEVGIFLGIGRSKAYELVKQSGFPAVRLGRLIRVPTSALLDWLDRQATGNDRWAS